MTKIIVENLSNICNVFSNSVTFCSRAVQFFLQVSMTAALVAKEETAMPVAPIVRVAHVGALLG